LVAALAFALAAAGFGVYAHNEKLVALTQRARAEGALHAATRTANALVSDVVGKFRYVVGVPTSTIKAILDPALQLQDDLVRAGDSDPDLLHSQSTALNAAVDTLLTLGDLKDAIADAIKSRDIMRALSKSHPTDPGWLSDLGASLKAIGNVDETVGDQSGALAAYQEELAIARELAKDKTNLRAQSDVWRSLINVGDVDLMAPDMAGASAAFQESLAVARDLAKDKSNVEDQRNLSISLDKVGDVKLQAGDKDGALAAYQEESAIAHDFAKDNANALTQRDLGISSIKVGDIELQTGDKDHALAAYQEALAAFRELAKDQSNAQAQDDLVQGLEKIGDWELHADDRTSALAAYEEAFTVARRTSNVTSLADVAIHFLLAKEYQKSLEISDLVISLAPDKTWLYTNKADALMFLGRVDEARAIYIGRRGQGIYDKSWESMILDDFAVFRKAGLTNPLMDEIEKTFAVKKQP
jgi:tetratricopeptide (TPR) repeat protein